MPQTPIWIRIVKLHSLSTTLIKSTNIKKIISPILYHKQIWKFARSKNFYPSTKYSHLEENIWPFTRWKSSMNRPSRSVKQTWIYIIILPYLVFYSSKIAIKHTLENLLNSLQLYYSLCKLFRLVWLFKLNRSKTAQKFIRRTGSQRIDHNS